jgi:uncharacterized membrane protein YgaE (UPF0421/DUF939 family)
MRQSPYDRSSNHELQNMSKKEPEKPTPKEREKQEREARIAKALRDNLRRRKASMRKNKKTD